MKRIVTLLLMCAALGAVAEQAGNPADAAMARMRDAMKKLGQRIAEADAATATAQAAQFAAEGKLKEAEAKIATLTKDLKTETADHKAEKETSGKTIKDLTAKLATKEKEVAAYSKSLKEWEAGYKKASDVANAKESERAEAAGKAIVMERKAQEHERKNREMYKLGTEILERYKSFGLGTALLAREPFVGSMRVKFENYIQDYGDKLASQRIKEGATKDSAAKKTEAAAQPAKP